MSRRNFFALLAMYLLLMVGLMPAAAQEPQSSAEGGTSAAALLSGPCVAGGAYDPACDVNHDGTIDTVDLQLAASNWGTFGTWTSGSWDLMGNSGTTAGLNFLGTTDNQALELHVNSARALRLEPDATSPNLIGGHAANTVTGAFGATIGGGGQSAQGNTINANFATIGGGLDNQASGQGATVAGGDNNTASTRFAAIAGGEDNTANDWGAVGGGQGNSATGVGSTVGGGTNNTAAAQADTVGGGDQNSANGSVSTVAGGGSNSATASRATVGGGSNNAASGTWATVSGGWTNTADASYAAIGGGATNTVTDNYGTVGGGLDNTAGDSDAIATDADYATVAGGQGNTASDEWASVGGGNGNTASGDHATVSGGSTNTANANNAFIGGGVANGVTDDYGTVGGGLDNTAGDSDAILTDADYATVAGGQGNTASDEWASVGGGLNNTASGQIATIAGGTENRAQSNNSAIGGGWDNETGGDGATVAGGAHNTASGPSAAIGGGNANTASGQYSMVPGGIANEAAGVNSFAAGQRAKANHDGTFVWGDQISADFTSTGANQFLIRAVGGVGIGRNAPTHQLDVQGGVRIRPQTNTNLLVTGATDDIYIDLIKHTNTVASARIEFEGFTNPGDHEGEIAFFTRTTAGPAMFERMRIKADGTVGIGTTSIDAGTLFEVDGGDIRVTGGDFVDDGTTLNAPDYVFGADYPLLTLAELERHIARYGHLPNVPSADDIQRDGLNLSRFQMVLLEKIEELTLYTLQQQAAIEARDTQIAQLEARLTALEAAAPTR